MMKMMRCNELNLCSRLSIVGGAVAVVVGATTIRVGVADLLIRVAGNNTQHSVKKKSESSGLMAAGKDTHLVGKSTKLDKPSLSIPHQNLTSNETS
eukprot:scaffold41353_cov91-Cyclotella_meneghiniana.AAC.4